MLVSAIDSVGERPQDHEADLNKFRHSMHFESVWHRFTVLWFPCALASAKPWHNVQKRDGVDANTIKALVCEIRVGTA